MKTLLICHEGALLSADGIARWLSSFSQFVGCVQLQDDNSAFLRRLKREKDRVGIPRLFDILAFRIYYRLLLAKGDQAWEHHKLEELRRCYPVTTAAPPILCASTPNSPEVEQFIRDLAPDIIIARCKVILKQRIFTLARVGTFVMHPGICPEYRNSHGCFWALANGDLDKVGMSLLKIDAGVDTGPIYGYFYCNYDETKETHIVIQHRVVFDNLDAIQAKLQDVFEGNAKPIDTTGRPSAAWGQPWLSSYLRWKFAARQRMRKR